MMQRSLPWDIQKPLRVRTRLRLFAFFEMGIEVNCGQEGWHSQRIFAGHMSVDHGRPQIRMTEQILDGASVPPSSR